MVYDFNTQLKKAQPDERRAVELLNRFEEYEHYVHKSEGIADAHDPNSDKWLEIKVDYRDTSNHFIERYSNGEAKTPGGPWQYVERGAELYCFYHEVQGELYVYRTRDLIVRMESLFSRGVLSDHQDGVKVDQNADYYTFGYKVPKSCFSDLCLLYFSEDESIAAKSENVFPQDFYHPLGSISDSQSKKEAIGDDKNNVSEFVDQPAVRNAIKRLSWRWVRMVAVVGVIGLVAWTIFSFKGFSNQSFVEPNSIQKHDYRQNTIEEEKSQRKLKTFDEIRQAIREL